MDLNLTNKEIMFLKDLGKELREQSNDCQASPRFWTVGDYVVKIVADGYGDDSKILVPEWEWQLFDMFDLKNNVSEDCDFSEEVMKDFESAYDLYELLDLVQEHVDSEASIVQVSKEHVIRPNTMFLTKQEAKDHIELNHYHYTSEAHTYAMTAWRAPKVERLLGILYKL